MTKIKKIIPIKNGKVEIVYSNGNIYKGYVNINKLFNGYGQYYIKERNIVISGYFRDSHIDYGEIIYYNTKNIYKGRILFLKAHGRGVLVSVNGEVFDGYFIDNKINGYGFYYTNNNKFYGYWYHGRLYKNFNKFKKYRKSVENSPSKPLEILEEKSFHNNLMLLSNVAIRIGYI